MPFLKSQIEQLSAPIDDDLACGVYLKSDKNAFRPLRNEFNVAQTALRKLCQNPSTEEQRELKEACLDSWQVLSVTLLEQFSNKTRDIELIAWFIAAQFILDTSIESAANSFEWLANLVEEQWADLNPVLPLKQLRLESEDGQAKEQVDAKAKAFSQLVGDREESSILYAPILQLPLIGDVTFFNYQSAEKRGEISLLKSSLTASVANERIAIQSKMVNVERCIEQLDRLAKLVSRYTQNVSTQGVNFGFVKSILTRVNNALEQLSGIKLATNEVPSEMGKDHQLENLTDDEQAKDSSQTTTVHAKSAPQRLHAGNLSEWSKLNTMNRDLAFHLLQEVSDYFRQSEPHSPVSFLLEKAIRWGYLSLPEMLQEMMSEQSETSIRAVCNAAGLSHLGALPLAEERPLRGDIKNIPTPQLTPTTSGNLGVENQITQVPSSTDTQSDKDDELESSSSLDLSW
ncbi:type VI secretion protein [Vibrio pectenicida]|uniref:Type VI secretion protein n=1 Tax=Vibrio pectenicida TaxID=62763 RepID=A0A7Y3ZWG0_9VIBR|nr:type VI secretion protein [Vibrio pectenicida]